MSPLLKKAFVFAVLTHIAFMLFWGGSTYLSMGLGWGRKVEVNSNPVDFIAIDDDFSIGDETAIQSQGDEGGITDTPTEEDIPEQVEPEPEPITKPAENEAEKVIEENEGEDRAPTENVENRGTNFTQTESGNDTAANANDSLGVDEMLIEEQPSQEKTKEEPKEEPIDPASRLRFPIPATDVATPPNRPSDLKNIANKLDSAPKPQAQGNQERAGQEGTPGAEGDSLEDILGNATSGGNTLKASDAIAKQVGERGCYNPPIIPTQKTYRIPVVVTLSSSGQITDASFKAGYSPQDDYEDKRAQAALRAVQDPRCNTIEALSGQVEEGRKETIIFP